VAEATPNLCGQEGAYVVDMFLLFAIVFLSVTLGVGLSAALLSLLFRLLMRLPGTTRARALKPAPVSPQSTPRS